MSKSCTFLFFISTLLVVVSCHSDDQLSTQSICDKNDISSSKLISVRDANHLINTESSIIPIEVSKVKEYKSGHIPSAVNVWRPDFRSKVFSTYKGMMCSKNELQSFLQNLGMTSNSHLLIYDNKGGCDAMRLAWVLDFYGMKDYQVINGGKSTWIQTGLPIDTITSIPSPNLDFKLSTTGDSTMCADRYDILAAIDDPNTIIVDTREPYEYRGEPFIAGNMVLPYKAGAFTRGSIPGAVHLNWSDLSDLAKDHRIKCTKDLIYNLQQKGITKDKKVIVYCQSGSRSSHTAFVLRDILKYPHVQNYDGSWIEWSYYNTNGADVPITKITSDKEFDKLFLELSEKLKK